MIEDRELESWRAEWSEAAGPSLDFERKVLARIKREDRRFRLGNVATAIAFTGMLAFSWFVRHRAGWLGSGWATGICILVGVSVGSRLWVMRKTWRAETQTTRAFVELWRRRAMARLRLLKIGIFVSVGWLIACALLTWSNWGSIGREVRAHPGDWLAVLILSVVMQPVLLIWARWLGRRKEAELAEAGRILEELTGEEPLKRR